MRTPEEIFAEIKNRPSQEQTALISRKQIAAIQHESRLSALREASYEQLNREIRSRPITHLPGMLQSLVRVCSIKPVFKNKDAMLSFVGKAWDMGGVAASELRDTAKAAALEKESE